MNRSLGSRSGGGGGGGVGADCGAAASSSGDCHRLTAPAVTEDDMARFAAVRENDGDEDEDEEEEEEAGELSLREWLDRPGRAVDAGESLHVFRQVAEAVAAAHAQGVVVGNVRPSCFVLSLPFARVAFIESASCSISGGSSDSSDDASAASYSPKAVAAKSELTRRRRDAGSMSGDAAGVDKKAFPLKQILAVELSWYTSPEEAEGGVSSFSSDIYRLGVLLFELFSTFGSPEEKLRAMADLRHRVLPPPLLFKFRKEASFCLWLLHPQPESRPKGSEVLQSELLNQLKDSLEEREVAMRLKEELEDQDLLLDFLLQLQQRKQEASAKLQDLISVLSSDIDDVLQQQSMLWQGGGSNSDLDSGECSGIDRFDHLLHEEDPFFFASKKRYRPELHFLDIEEQIKFPFEASGSDASSVIQEKVLSKSSRLMKNFKKLEAAYFLTRSKFNRQLNFQETSGPGSVAAERSSVNDPSLDRSCYGGRDNGWMGSFLDGLCSYLSFSRLKVRAELKQCDLLGSSNLVCSLAFDRDKEFFATAGVNKKIKVFEYDMILNGDRDIHYPIVEMSNNSKLSCICWNSYVKSQIASCDFEGVVQVWDVTRSQAFLELMEHDKRVWSVDFSVVDPTKMASGSDDGSVKLWNINQVGSIGTIRTKANVCSVQFQPDSAHLISIGSADHNIYCYDLRNLRHPYWTVTGHTKTVSYVRYLDASRLVSASTDNSLKLWELSTSQRLTNNSLQTFTGHTNTKNFVGLSISDGFIATGSETNEVFVYHNAFPMPVMSYRFDVTDPISGQELDDPSQFVSCVCWRSQSFTLLAANSSGNIKILEMD